MNLRQRAWRQRVAEMVQRIDERLRRWDDLEDETRHRLLSLRERLAGTLGAEEGASSTPQLRRRCAQDYAAAADLLGLEDTPPLEPPRGRGPQVILEKTFMSHGPALPRRGDAC